MFMNRNTQYARLRKKLSNNSIFSRTHQFTKSYPAEKKTASLVLQHTIKTCEFYSNIERVFMSDPQQLY